jgi:hypothetical protein
VYFDGYDSSGIPDSVNVSVKDGFGYNETWELTAPDWYLEVCDLLPGTYTIAEISIPGWTTTYPDGMTVDVLADITVYISINNTLDYCDETAWAYYNEEYSLPIWDYAKGNNWGWTNGPLSEGYYEFELWAGAGLNNLSNGVLVGMVYVDYDGDCVNVTYELDDGYHLEEIHLWVGDEVLPRDKYGRFTNAPGQFPYGTSFDSGAKDDYWTWESCGFNGNIYVAAHAVVLLPCDGA